MNPRYAAGIDWGSEQEYEAIAEHLARHQIREWAVEAVFLNEPRFVRNKKDRAGDFRMIGRTDGGRRLTIVVRTVPETHLLRPITGWPTDGRPSILPARTLDW